MSEKNKLRRAFAVLFSLMVLFILGPLCPRTMGQAIYRYDVIATSSGSVAVSIP